MNIRLSRNNKIGLFFFLAFVLSSTLIWLFEERFNKEQWRGRPTLRYKIVDDLIESQILIDKSKDQVIMLLGEPNISSSTSQDIFLYKIGKQPSFFENERELLLIMFKNKKVIKVALTKE